MPLCWVMPSVDWAYRSALPACMAPMLPIPRYVLNVRPRYRIVCPGLSVNPANNPPIITLLAPSASTFVMSPL